MFKTVRWYAEFNPFDIDFNEDVSKSVTEHFNPTEGAPKDLLTSIGEFGVVVVSLIAFLWVAYAAVAKFRACQKGQADWGELLVLALVAAVLLVWVSFLLFQAARITDAGT